MPTDDLMLRISPPSELTPGGRLFCLPHAGGGTATYRPWPAHLGGRIEVWAADLPGRESRLFEPPVSDPDELVHGLFEAVAPRTELPYVLFGHSMGAVLAYELARTLQRSGLPAPQCLIVSGHRAPHLPPAGEPLHRLPDDALVEQLRGFGGTPAEVLETPELLELVLPTLRADLSVAETYRHRLGPRLTCPVTVLRGSRDTDVPAAGAAAWADLVADPPRQLCWEGDHFFHLDHAPEVAELVLAGLAETGRGPQLAASGADRPARPTYRNGETR